MKYIVTKIHTFSLNTESQQNEINNNQNADLWKYILQLIQTRKLGQKQIVTLSNTNKRKDFKL